MIANVLVGIVSSVLTTILGGLAALVPAVPGGLTTALGVVGGFFDLLRGFDTWVPVTFTFVVVGAVYACYITAWILGMVRMILSYLLLGGGAT